MNRLTLTQNKDGAILHFDDGTRALVNGAHHNISANWKIGLELLMFRPPGSIPGTFHLHCTESEFVDCSWYSGNEQIV